MAMSPGMRMLMLARNNDKVQRSEYSDLGDRRLIGFDRDGPHNRMRGNRMTDDRMYGDRMYGDRMYDDGQMYDRRYPSNEYGGNTGHMWPPVRPMNGRDGNSYGDIYASGTIYAPGAMNKPSQGVDSMRYNNNEDESVDEHKARKWVEKMSSGEHFKPDQAEQHRQNYCPNCDKWEYYVALNAMYSDHQKTAQKFGMDKPEFYAYLAKDFLMDEDAKPGKLAKYMREIPK